jgi:hypothetical protein
MPLRQTLIIFLGLLAAGSLAQGASPVSKGKPVRSDICGECHRDIYRMWRGSIHARALEDPIFLDAYRETSAAEGETISRICLTCHAPAAGILNDPGLKEKVTWEGVNCALCHSITRVELGSRGPKLPFDLGAVKRGPIKDAASMVHEVAYSELHTTAAICAGCHEYVNGQGTPIITTYSEWQQSPAAKEGRTCQDCHMSKTKAAVVDPKVLRVPESEVNLHEVPGGHSIDQLNKALGVNLQPERAGGKLKLRVILTNRGAGHSVPTGMPARHVTLEVQLRTSDKQHLQEQRVYGASFTDAAGQTITEDRKHFAPGVRPAADTRIKAGEQRQEDFEFPVDPKATAFLTVRLVYEHSPTGTKEDQTLITFYTAERTLQPEAPGGAQ